jgi:formate hydrogenlyase transcriptional activator
MPSSAPIRPDPTHARYETLLEVAESIVAHRQLSTLFADLSRCLNQLVSFDFISLTLLDANREAVRLHLLQTDRKVIGTPPQDAIPVEQTPTGAAIRTRQPQYLANVTADDRFPVIRPLLLANGIESVCVLPLFTAQCDLGGLMFGSERPDAYSADDIEFIESNDLADYPLITELGPELAVDMFGDEFDAALEDLINRLTVDLD